MVLKTYKPDFRSTEVLIYLCGVNAGEKRHNDMCFHEVLSLSTYVLVATDEQKHCTLEQRLGRRPSNEPLPQNKPWVLLESVLSAESSIWTKCENSQGFQNGVLRDTCMSSFVAFS